MDFQTLSTIKGKRELLKKLHTYETYKYKDTKISINKINIQFNYFIFVHILEHVNVLINGFLESTIINLLVNCI